MLTKSIEASWSLFLIQHGLSSSFPKVLAKYNYMSLEEIQNCSVEQDFFFLIVACFYLFCLSHPRGTMVLLKEKCIENKLK